jgi:hypothetical protein
MSPARDRRYSIRREWCGFLTPQWCVRFCDEWIGCAPTRSLAVEIRDAHHAERKAWLAAAHAEAMAAIAARGLAHSIDHARRTALQRDRAAFLPA